MRSQSIARTGLAVVGGLFVACVVVQLFLAGLGVFDSPGAFITHREFGYTFGWLTLVLVVLAIVGRVPRPLLGLSVLLLVQVALQSVLVAFRADMPAIAALHPLNGALMLAVAIVITRRAWALRSAPVPSSTNAPVDATVEAAA